MPNELRGRELRENFNNIKNMETIKKNQSEMKCTQMK